MTRDDSRWFAVRSVCLHDAPSASNAQHAFEERIALFLAVDEHDAIHMAEREAESYNGESTGYFMSYELVDDSPIGPGHELFSLMRGSDLTIDSGRM